jgi:hypothetical protein
MWSPSMWSTNIFNAAIENATFSIPPGEEANVLLRLIEENPFETKLMQNGEIFDLLAFANDIGGGVTAQQVNTSDAEAGIRIPRAAATKLLLGTAALPDGSEGVEYTGGYVDAVGGDSSSYVYALNSGELPPGLDIYTGYSASYPYPRGIIDGTPTTAGTYHFVVQVYDGFETDNQAYKITIHEGPVPDTPTITTPSPLRNAVQGVYYGVGLEASGGQLPYIWTLEPSSSLPGNLNLDEGGAITGKPVAPIGPYTFTVRVTDRYGEYDTKQFSLEIKEFTGEDVTISGMVYDTDGITPLNDVVIRGLPNTPITGAEEGWADGYYEDTVPQGWEGTARPFKLGHSFDPETREYTYADTEPPATTIPNQYYNAVLPGVTVSGTLTYNGAPLVPNKVDPGQGNHEAFFYGDQGEGEWDFTAIYNYDDGTFTIENVTPGEDYSLNVHVDPDSPFGLQRRPGTFSGYLDFNVPEGQPTVEIDVPCHIYMHLTSPVDGSDAGPKTEPPAHSWMSPVTFTWGAVEGAQDYTYSVNRSYYDNTPSELVIRETINQTTVDVPLIPSGANDYYVFFVYAENSSNDILGTLYIVWDSGTTTSSYYFLVDNTLPIVENLTLNPPSPIKEGVNITFTIEFNETMDTAVSPTVTFGSSPIAITQTDYTESIWTGTYTTNGTESEGVQTISISGAKDLAGNTMVPNTSYSFETDFSPPTIASIQLDPPGPLKAESVTFTIVFDEEMNTGAPLTVQFGSPVPDKTVILSSYVGDTWIGTYTIEPGYDGVQNFSINGATDLAGNMWVGDTGFTFIVDTAPPDTALVTTPSGIIASPPTIVSGQVGDNATGAGLDANSATFYIEDKNAVKFWDGDSWEATVTWLATTHSATTDGSEVAWDDNITLPPWIDGNDYELKAKATDRAGNVYIGPATTFSIELATYGISGTVTSEGLGLQDVDMGGLPGAPTTNENGDYSASVDLGWSGTVTPEKVGYTFNPVSRSYSDIQSEQIDQDYTASREELWVSRYNGTGNDVDQANDIAIDSSGNVYVTGYSTGSSTGKDIVTIKYDSNGGQLWAVRYDGAGSADDEGVGIAVDSSGNVYVAGWSSEGTSGFDYYIAKYNSSGGLIWDETYDGGINFFDKAFAMTIDSSGNVFVTGDSNEDGTGEGMTTLKYGTNGGSPQWVGRYTGPTTAGDWGIGIVLDSSSNVYVIGNSYGSSSLVDIVTIKYNSSGIEQWAKRYNGPENSYDYATGIAVDPSGNVCVTGRTDGSGTGYDWYTAKYPYDGGDPIWEVIYDGPSEFDDNTSDIAVDSSGHVYVTGYHWTSHTGGSGQKYYTVKYNDSSGAVMWDATYAGPTTHQDIASVLTLDPSGNVYVTGKTYTGFFSDFATIKYDSAGNMLWVARHEGPGGQNDGGTAIAVDSGYVYVTGSSYIDATNGTDTCTIKYRNIN